MGILAPKAVTTRPGAGIGPRGSPNGARAAVCLGDVGGSAVAISGFPTAGDGSKSSPRSSGVFFCFDSAQSSSRMFPALADRRAVRLAALCSALRVFSSNRIFFSVRKLSESRSFSRPASVFASDLLSSAILALSAFRVRSSSAKRVASSRSFGIAARKRMALLMVFSGDCGMAISLAAGIRAILCSAESVAASCPWRRAIAADFDRSCSCSCLSLACSLSALAE